MNDNPQIVLNNGGHIKTWAEDLGGYVVGLHQIYLPPNGVMEEDTFIISTQEMKLIIEWMNRDRETEHREKMKQVIKVVE